MNKFWLLLWVAGMVMVVLLTVTFCITAAQDRALLSEDRSACLKSGGSWVDRSACIR